MLMTKERELFMQNIRDGLITFCRDLVRIKSVTGQEEPVLRRIKAEMEKLGYDRIWTDSVGNLIGQIGTGNAVILFDSHTDTVSADESGWSFPPFEGRILNGKLCGRGSVDMKSSLAASVYGAYIARELGCIRGKTVLVSCSVMEEDFDGVALDRELDELEKVPQCAVICEPTNLRLGLGHQGRALYNITSKGVGVHASRHYLGVNALYEMMPVLKRIREKGIRLAQEGGERGSIAVTRITSEAGSINSIPHSCTITVDRRLTKSDTADTLKREAEDFIGNGDAVWEICNISGKSWRGTPVTLRSYLPGWQISEDSALAMAARSAIKEAGIEPVSYIRSGCTNGVATAGKRGIPTILFGAGDEKLCHMPDEYCPLEDIVSAAAVYSILIRNLSANGEAAYKSI